MINLLFQKGKDGKVTTILKYGNHLVGRVTTSDSKNFSKEEGFLWCWLLYINSLDKKKLYKMYSMCLKTERVNMLKFLLEEHNKHLKFNFDEINNMLVKGGDK